MHKKTSGQFKSRRLFSIPTMYQGSDSDLLQLEGTFRQIDNLHIQILHQKILGLGQD